MSYNIVQQNEISGISRGVEQSEMVLDSNYILSYAESNNVTELHSSMLANHMPDRAKSYMERMSEDKIALLLAFMEKKGLLTKRNHGLMHACPACNSLIVHTSCKACGSRKTQMERKIVHKTCGHIGNHEDFVDENGLRCPKCGDRINYTKDGGITGEYSFCDITYKCLDCSSQVSNYNSDERIECPSCSRSVKKTHAKTYDLTVYLQEETFSN